MNENIKNAIQSIPNVVSAYLFGSRASGTHKPTSDYDVCIVISDDNKDIVYDTLVDYMMKNKEFIQPLIYTKKEFEEKMKIAIYNTAIIKKGISIV